jgi:hypothetical protein
MSPTAQTPKFPGLVAMDLAEAPTVKSLYGSASIARPASLSSNAPSRILSTTSPPKKRFSIGTGISTKLSLPKAWISASILGPIF